MSRINDERLEELREAFEAADSNDDGHIDEHEFVAFRPGFQLRHLPDPDVSGLVSKYQ